MSDEAVFLPALRVGIAFHIVLVLALAALAGLGFYQVAHIEVGLLFLLYLLLTLLVLGALPVVIYRLYALQNASYAIEREGVRLRWGLRREHIPMDEILWVHLDAEFKTPLLLPRLSWPGAVLGVRRQSGLGEVEFLSSRRHGLVLIATPRRTYAISPHRPGAFQSAFERTIEMGSLSPLPAFSAYPIVLARQVWQARPGRLLLLGELALGLLLLLFVILLIPGRQQVTLGFRPDGAPGDQASAPRLLLLPLVNTFFLVADTVAGLFFFRRKDGQPIAYLLWGASILTSLLFMAGVLFLLRAG